MTPSRRASLAILVTAALGVLTACGGAGSTLDTSAPATASSSSTAARAQAAPPATTSQVAATPRITATLATGLRSPWGLAFLPGGGALLSERDTGRILRLDGLGHGSVLGTVPGVAHGGEGGLLGLAVSPRFGTDRLVYAYLTTSRDNRVVRIRWPIGRSLGTPVPILTGIPKATHHNGGRLLFGPDGMLYVSTGDAGQGGAAQSKRSLGGKILRITASGAPARGNPFVGSRVWSFGHRNVQGLAFDPAGRLWASEFGQNTWDELNLIRKGGNYGWPVVEGRSGRRGYIDPLRQWPTSQASPSGIAVARGIVWLAALRGERLWAVPVTGASTGTPRAYFSGQLGRLRTVAAAPDGSLWLVTNTTDGRQTPRPGGDRVLRIALR